MSRFNTSANHPLIPNSQEYTVYKKVVSIHSEDRDLVKYPSSSQFEIELPQDYLNIREARLSSWTFPANYYTFSLFNKNIAMTFKITNPYNPNTGNLNDALQYQIYLILYANQSNNFLVTIESGFYNPIQMVTELTNRFNYAVSHYLYKELLAYDQSQTPPTTLADKFLQQSGYSDFVVVYNTVSQNIWFGNRSSGFILTNEDESVLSFYQQQTCYRTTLPDSSNWGLPSYLGLSRYNESSLSYDPTSFESHASPNFYYGDVTPGDGGVWLTPNPSLPNSIVHYVKCIKTINLMGPSHFYMEIAGLNCLDETSPFNVSKFTKQTNETNGIANSAFAKIAIPTTPISQWFDDEIDSYALFSPPLERMRKLSIKLRYHNGLLVDFSDYPFSFNIEFTLFSPQIERNWRLTKE